MLRHLRLIAVALPIGFVFLMLLAIFMRRETNLQDTSATIINRSIWPALKVPDDATDCYLYISASREAALFLRFQSADVDEWVRSRIDAGNLQKTSLQEAVYGISGSWPPAWFNFENAQAAECYVSPPSLGPPDSWHCLVVDRQDSIVYFVKLLM